MIRVWCCGYNLHAQPCWHAKCRGCGETTAFDFTEQDAREIVEHACKCEVRQLALEGVSS